MPRAAILPAPPTFSRKPWNSRRPSPRRGLRSAPSATASAIAPAPSHAFEKARDADPDDYHGARLQIARLGGGNAAPAMSETYVRRLFDQYAGRYDAALTERLAYRGPALLRDAVETRRARRGDRCIFPPCSISAAAPGSPARPFVLLLNGWWASISRPA